MSSFKFYFCPYDLEERKKTSFEGNEVPEYLGFCFRTIRMKVGDSVK